MHNIEKITNNSGTFKVTMLTIYMILTGIIDQQGMHICLLASSLPIAVVKNDQE